MVTKVIVAIEIESCQECPHFYASWVANKHNFCLEEDKVVENPHTIPDWCPFNEKISTYSDLLPTDGASTVSNYLRG
jgi:hypothetical protein